VQLQLDLVLDRLLDLRRSPFYLLKMP
jgi:hypothetical protein